MPFSMRYQFNSQVFLGTVDIKGLSRTWILYVPNNLEMATPQDVTF